MTGEVTLRGKALEICGVKEKVLAAYRAGLREVILPKTNEKDLRDVPDEVRANMAFSFVTTMDDVIRIALLGAAATIVATTSPGLLADHPPEDDALPAPPAAPPPAPTVPVSKRSPATPQMSARRRGGKPRS
jgi:hypothetical protein